MVEIVGKHRFVVVILWKNLRDGSFTPSRPSGTWFDVLCNGEVVGRIYRTPTHGYAATREAAMAAFAETWGRKWLQIDVARADHAPAGLAWCRRVSVVLDSLYLIQKMRIDQITLLVSGILVESPPAGAGTINATALGRNGQLCCCAVSCGVWTSLVGDRFLVHER